MDPERWRRVGDLFGAAADLAPDARAALLDQASAGDPALRREVERLLAHDDRTAAWEAVPAAALAGRLLAGPSGADPERDDPERGDPERDDPERAGRRCGPYRLVREVGRGGTGVVYLAERDDGRFQRQMAVKLIQRGLDTDEVLRRFQGEPAALGRLDHPDIARIYDAGAGADGRPYLVLEYVDGLPIDAWCDGRRLPLRARLQLFLRVLAAVDHAHRNLVAHRDLKPSNILVTAAGDPKLLDFGLAKLLDEAAAGPAGATAPTQRRLTPEYASPEQVQGGPASTATDVYSLGVVLYRLLTGRHPYEFQLRTPQEIERVVCTAEPDRPSARIGEDGGEVGGEAAALRADTPERLRRRLRGDLDTITLKALAKDPRQRYPSVEQLAEDLRRHLAGQPIRARPAGVWTRAAGLVRRHRIAAIFLLLAALFTAGVTVQSVRLERALARTTTALAQAEAERARAETAGDFLVGLFDDADPRTEGGGNPSARELVSAGAARATTELAGQPQLQAAVLNAVGEVHLNLGLYAEARPLLERALALRRRHGPHPDLAASLDLLGRLYRNTGDYRRAEVLLRAGLAQRRALFGDESVEMAESLNSLGLLLSQAGRVEEAETAHQQALAIRRRALGATAPETAESLSNLGSARFQRGDEAGAAPLFRAAAAAYERRYGPRHPSLATVLQNLALARQRADPAEAEALLRRALALHRSQLGGDHPEVATTLKNLGGLLLARGDAAAAEPLLREALALHRRRLGDLHPAVAGDLHDLAFLLQGRGDPAAAVPLFTEALALRRAVLPAGHLEIANSLIGLGSALTDLGRPAAGEPLLREGLALRRRQLPAGHWRVAAAESALGGCLTALGRRAEAAELLAASLAVLGSTRGPDDQLTRLARERLARLCAGAGAAEAVCLTPPSSGG